MEKGYEKIEEAVELLNKQGIKCPDCGKKLTLQICFTLLRIENEETINV